MLQVVQQGAGTNLLLGMGEPDLGQTLVGWQFASYATQELALHAGADAFVGRFIDFSFIFCPNI